VTELWERRETFSEPDEDARRVVERTSLCYQAKLEELDAKFQQTKFATDYTERDLEEELSRCSEYTQKILECKVMATRSVTITHVPEAGARSLLRQPVAPLPKFHSMEGEDLESFLAEFEDTIGRYSYPEYDRLLLLKQQLSGRALTLVNSLEANQRGYQQAKELLRTALASTDIQKFNAVKQIAGMKLTYTSDPYEYVSQMRLLTERVKKLKIDSDFFLQYFFWRGLNEQFQNTMVNITNNIRPSLEEIKDNYFSTCDRYLQQQKKFQEKREYNPKISPSRSPTNIKKSTGFAADIISLNRPTCVLCSSEEGCYPHNIHKCTNYDTRDKKLLKLQQLKLCTKCTRDHDGPCRELLYACLYCGGPHYSCLCLDTKKGDMSAKTSFSTNNTERSLGSPERKRPTVRFHSPVKVGSKENSINKNKTGKDSPRKSSNTFNGYSEVEEILGMGVDTQVILPTFTCNLNNKLIRVLKDSGCQSNFVEEKLAKSLNLEIVKNNVELRVRGINTCQEYKSKIVKLNIMIGNKMQNINAYCIPNININLCLAGLKTVVKGFMDRGYQLADDSLTHETDYLNNIKLIMGIKSSACLPEMETPFGKNDKSLFSDTSMGVIIKGDIKQLLKDINNLSSRKDNNKYYNICNLIQDEPSINFKPEFEIANNKGRLIESELTKATQQVLENRCLRYTNYDQSIFKEDSPEVNDKLVKFALNNLSIDLNGRIIMPLLWNAKVSHMLGKNGGLAKLILKSNLSRYNNNNSKLLLIDETFREQEELDIIEKIYNSNEYLEEHPNHSFLAHVPVFKLDRETTKCRIAFLSSLCEKKTSALSYSGPCLNRDLDISLIHHRFDSKICGFDLKKAFNNIALREVDQNRLLFYWFKNVKKGDFSPILYKNVRLNFGLRCSPTLLMLALYKILILDAENNNIKLRNLKKLIYHLSYMDNCAITSNDTEELINQYNQLNSIFNAYRIEIQQFVCNDEKTRPIELDINASTKRKILSTVASQFDLYNFNCPLLNRSRLFLHNLQCDKVLGWDQKLPENQLREWKNISNQANASIELEVPRFIGPRNESYNLVAFPDSSKSIYGIVIYMQNILTGDISFIAAKNHIINQQLKPKSIPSLEVQGITLAVEQLINLYKILTGTSCMYPIKIKELIVCSDSMVALQCIHAYDTKLDKMQKKSIFVLNRLSKIQRLCEEHPIKFLFTAGLDNPADCVTRCLSYNILIKTSFLRGPKFLRESKSEEDRFSVIVPNPEIQEFKLQSLALTTEIIAVDAVHLSSLARCSKLKRFISTFKMVLIFINNLKRTLKRSSLRHLNLAVHA
jgi:hypothetical protein